jgi:hypothetical protein
LQRSQNRSDDLMSAEAGSGVDVETVWAQLRQSRFGWCVAVNHEGTVVSLGGPEWLAYPHQIPCIRSLAARSARGTSGRIPACTKSRPPPANLRGDLGDSLFTNARLRENSRVMHDMDLTRSNVPSTHAMPVSESRTALPGCRQESSPASPYRVRSGTSAQADRRRWAAA